MSPKPASHRTDRTPRGHWVLVSLLVFVFAIGLLIEGYTHGVLGENSASEPPANQPGQAVLDRLTNNGCGLSVASPHAQPAPASVMNGGPVITVVNGQPRSYQIPPKTVILSFDDGPDPTWTPQILAILQRYRVPANFFVVGAHAASYPGLVAAELRDGDQVGSHTYTHVNLGTSPSWRESLELTLTQNALAGATGIHTRLLRMPYSSEPDAMTATDWRAARQAATDGYLVVFTSLDTMDWARPGVRHIVAAAMPVDGRGAIIMFHDGGGDRSQTVAALPAIIERLRASGYRFATVTSALKLAAGDVPVTGSQHLVGNTLVLTQQASDHAVAVLAVALIIMSVLTVLRLLFLVGFSVAHRRRERRSIRRVPADSPPYLPDVSIVIPAYNEAAGIAATVRSMAESRYRGRLEIIVVDDGSTDDTAAIGRGLGIPYVRVISQANLGKPGALNSGIVAAYSEVLILVDGDTVFEPDTIERLVAPLQDPGVGAVSGNTKVGNRRGFIGGWQHLEYVLGFNLDRRMYDMLGIMPTVPGAIGAFRRQALAYAGGVSSDTLAEDTDLTMAISRSRWRIVYAAGAVAWTEAPSTLRQLWKQRYRWSYGTMQAMWKHRHAVIERGRSGRFGRLCLTYLTLYQVLLPLVAPAIDVSSIYGLVFLNPVEVAAFWLSFVALQAVAGGYALRIDSERLRALWVLPFQQVVYRQLMYLVTIQSVMTALLGTRQRWQAIGRTGVFAGEGLPTESTVQSLCASRYRLAVLGHMGEDQVDALVIFGATGDLAKLETFPALVGLVDRGVLAVPVIGVAKSGWGLPQFRDYAAASLKLNNMDPASPAAVKMLDLLRYVDGDLTDPATYAAMSDELGAARQILYYLEVPPALFGRIAEGISGAGRAAGSRVMVEKPFGNDLASAQALNQTLHRFFPEEAIYRVDHWLGLDPVESLMFARFANSVIEPLLNRSHVQSIQITMAEAFDVADRGSFYDKTGALKDVVQNHMLQVLATVLADPPDGSGLNSWIVSKSQLIGALRPLGPSDVVKGQYDGYLSVAGVTPGSRTETFAAVRLAADSWRWAGVPILIRVGKCLPVTATEVSIRFRRPPQDAFRLGDGPTGNGLRFRIYPENRASLTLVGKKPGAGWEPEVQELVFAEHPGAEMRPYNRLIGAALGGERWLFAQEDTVEACWRVVDPIVGDVGPVVRYPRGSWGPDATSLLDQGDTWYDPGG